MGKFLIRILTGTAGLWFATWLLPGMQINSAATAQMAPDQAPAVDLLGLVFIGLIFGLVNALIKPLVSLISLPVTLLTLGLFTVIINAAMLWLTSWLSSFTPFQLSIDSFFWTAILAAILVSLIGMLGNAVTGVNRRS